MSGIAKILSAAGWAGLLCMATGAQAETANFNYRSDELQSMQGVNQLLKRLRAVAQAECRPSILVLTKAELKCRRDVEAQWVARIASPMLTKLSRDTTANIAR